MEFNSKGEVIIGALAEDTAIGNKPYPAGTKLSFSDAGDVTVTK